MNAHAPVKPHYPHKAKVKAAAEMLTELRAAGLDVAAIKVSPDGSIEVFSPAAFPARPHDEWEAWHESGAI